MALPSLFVPLASSASWGDLVEEEVGRDEERRARDRELAMLADDSKDGINLMMRQLRLGVVAGGVGGGGGGWGGGVGGGGGGGRPPWGSGPLPHPLPLPRSPCLLPLYSPPPGPPPASAA